MSRNPWVGIEQAVLRGEVDSQDVDLVRSEPTAAEYAQGFVNPTTRAAAHRSGVVWYGDYQTLDDGMCRHVRLQARALHDAGVATKLVATSHSIRIGKPPIPDPLQLPPGNYPASEDLLDPGVREVVRPLTMTTISAPDVVIRQAPFATSQQLLMHAIPKYAQVDPKQASAILSRTIVYLPWERSMVTPDYAQALSRFGGVWLQSRRHLDIFAAAGIPTDLLTWIPNVYDADCPPAQLGRSGAPVPQGKHFYHIGKWEPRKNQHALIGAFLLGFKPGENATLFIKTHPFGNWAGYPDGPGSVMHWLSQPEVKARGWTIDTFNQHVRIVDVTYSDHELTERLHKRCNIYVSTGAGEAWDYPAFDAKLAGNRLVYVGFGGPEDYASAGDQRVLWELGPVHPGYPWGKDAKWAHYSVRALSDALVRAEPAKARVPDPHLERFTQSAVAPLMMEAIAKLLMTTVDGWLDGGARRR